MKQIIQDLKNGKTILEDVPVPSVGFGKVLIKTHSSLVSQGTEKMLVNFGQSNLFDKARLQPEKVRQVFDKMKSDGIQPTIEAVFRKLGTPIPLGYSQAGEVIEIGRGVSDFKPGDRVISNGHHAEFVVVPQNLVAKIPEGVSYEEASFTVVGAIGLQGIRLVQPNLGETVAVIGLGLIGLITCQLLIANGCRVVGFDIDEYKLKKANSLGIKSVNSADQNPVRFIEDFTAGIGADSVIITASTSSNEVIKQVAQMSRKRGRIVLIGVIGLNIDRSDFYEKELTFQVSCSYGPGRYDDKYEQQGIDYPVAYVRWTEKRNFEAVLESIRCGSLDVKSLISERVKLNNYLQIYGNMGNSSNIASILEYPLPQKDDLAKKLSINDSTITIKNVPLKLGDSGIAIIGAGNFTQGMILPALKKAKAEVKIIVSSTGLSSTNLAKKFQIPISSTNIDVVLSDPTINGVVITTQHHLHAAMTIKALKANKQVFVEKPLALNNDELNEVIEAVNQSGKTVTVGFNRRFSPHSIKMKSFLGRKPGPMNVIATMNAGFIPSDVWVQSMETGGGRIIGEACHMIDLITYLTGSLVIEVRMQSMGVNPAINTDNASIHLKYANGSLGVINYFANGNKSYSKERVEVYYQGKNLILDNFRRLDGYGFGSGFTSKLLKTRQDKGHQKQFKLLTQYWKEGGEPLIPFDEIVNTTRASFAAVESLKSKRIITIDFV